MNQALIAAAVRRVRRPIRRPDRARASRGVRAAGRAASTHTSPRQADRDSRAGARRLPAGQHAVRGAGRRPAADRRRLADRHLGSGDDRRRLLPRLRAARRRAPRQLRRAAAARTTTRSGPNAAAEPGRRSRRRSPPELLRRDDGDRRVRCSSSAPSAATRCSWRCCERHSQHVLDTDALATLPEPAAPEAACSRPPTTRARTRPTRRAAVERELVLRLRRRGAGRRRLDPAGADTRTRTRPGSTRCCADPTCRPSQ